VASALAASQHRRRFSQGPILFKYRPELLAFLAGQTNQQDGQLRLALEFAEIIEQPGDLAGCVLFRQPRARMATVNTETSSTCDTRIIPRWMALALRPPISPKAMPHFHRHNDGTDPRSNLPPLLQGDSFLAAL